MIRTRILVLMLIATVAAFVMVGVSNWMPYTVGEADAQKAKLMYTLRNHMEVDMMHEAVRGDVLIALREAQQYNTAGVGGAHDSLRAHLKKMEASITANKEAELSTELLAAFEDTMPALLAYKEEADAVITAAEANPLSAESGLGEFMQRFDELEEKLGAASGLIEEEIAASDAAVVEITSIAGPLLLIASAVLLIFSALPCYQVFFVLLGPLQKVIQQMLQLAQGNLDVELAGVERKDEIGSMLRAMQVFKDNALKTKQMERERGIAEERAKTDRQQGMHDLAQRFEQRVQGIITSVASASTELLQTAQGMSVAMEDANIKAASVANSAERTTGNVQTVASAAEEMTASVKEISSQVIKSTQVVADTVAKAQHADESAKQLEGAAQQIGHVVQLIQDIAEQINLLALNATIESARAGDAGKGFAVVASEVKNLATQTTKATEEIATQIEGIQSISKGVVIALNAIKTSIDHVSEYSGGIASAVEEQSAVTDEIAANMQIAASGTNDIRVNINEVTASAMSAKESANSVLEASRILSREAETLSREVADFLSEVRA